MLNFNKLQPPLFVREYWRKVFRPRLVEDGAVRDAVLTCTAWLERNNTYDVEIEKLTCRGKLVGREVSAVLGGRGRGGYHYYIFSVKFPFFAFQKVKVRLVEHLT